MAYVESSVRSRQVIAAARTALARDGVAKTSLRAVATEAGIPLGTLQYVFPSKELLLRAVIEDLVVEIETVLRESGDLEGGLAQAIRHGLRTFWATLVVEHRGLQVVQYELTTYALRTTGQEDLARWQYERYASVIAEWFEQAAQRAGEVCSVPFARLARVTLAAMDGLILQQVSSPDPVRSAEDLEAVIDMVVALSGVHATDRFPA